jgi:hypothetical protein
MADVVTSISIFHPQGSVTPASAEDELIRGASLSHEQIQRLATELVATAVRGGTVAARVDSLTSVAATGTITCVQADATAGDKLHFLLPGRSVPITLTAVAGAAGTDQYSIDTGDNEMAASLEAAIDASPRLAKWITASSSTDTVTITSTRGGTSANNLLMVKEVTTATTLALVQMSGGLDITSKPSMTVTFGSANITADDTISIGGRKYTWKASASADGEITLSTTEATVAANFAAAVNADANFTGLVTASVDSAVVTLTWEGDPRVGKHVVMDFTEANAGSVVLGGTLIIGTGEAFTLSTTATGQSATKRYEVGGQ